MDTQYTYLFLNIFTLLFPLLLSFDKKVAFFRKWKTLFPAIGFAGTIFIIWDIYFTQEGIWSFNPEYITGIHWGVLPMEECMFFLTVPYACVFIYECLNAYVAKDWLAQVSLPLSWILVFLLTSLAIAYRENAYTFVTFSLLAAWWLMNLLWLKPTYMGRFYMAYFVHLIPFFLINGVLTALPVVIYNNAENLSIRIGTVPVEDSMYSMLLLLMVINVYEVLNTKFSRVSPLPQQKSYA